MAILPAEAKRSRRDKVGKIVPPEPDAIPIVRSVVDPTLQWQGISSALEVRVDPSTALIHLRKVGESEACIFLTRDTLENVLRMIPKKVR